MIRFGCNPEVLNVDVTYYLIAFQQAKRHGNFAPDLDSYLPQNLTPSSEARVLLLKNDKRCRSVCERHQILDTLADYQLM